VSLFDSRRLGLGRHSRATVVALGEEAHQQAIVIDDFFEDPHYVRELALSLDFRSSRGTYPGYEARISLHTDELLERVRALVDARLQSTPTYRDVWVFSMMHEGFDPKWRHYPHPHVDHGVSDQALCLAALVYLNLPEQCRGGTAFYRHRETGLREQRGEITPGLASYMVKHGLCSVQDAYQHMEQAPEPSPEQLSQEWGYITDSNELWEKTALLEMRFNRFVLFDAYLFHNPSLRSGDFGQTPDTRRLTLTLFYELPWEDSPG
jgi:hypothetical protein